MKNRHLFKIFILAFVFVLSNNVVQSKALQKNAEISSDFRAQKVKEGNIVVYDTQKKEWKINHGDEVGYYDAPFYFLHATGSGCYASYVNLSMMRAGLECKDYDDCHIDMQCEQFVYKGRLFSLDKDRASILEHKYVELDDPSISGGVAGKIIGKDANIRDILPSVDIVNISARYNELDWHGTGTLVINSNKFVLINDRENTYNAGLYDLNGKPIEYSIYEGFIPVYEINKDMRAEYVGPGNYDNPIDVEIKLFKPEKLSKPDFWSKAKRNDLSEFINIINSENIDTITKYAVKYSNDIDVVSFLVGKYIEFNKSKDIRKLIMTSIENPNTSIIKYLLSVKNHENDINILTKAIVYGLDVDIIKILIEENKNDINDKDLYGYNPLHVVEYMPQREDIKNLLLEAYTSLKKEE